MPETEPQAATSPEPQATPAMDEPSPPAPDAEAAAPSETTEPPGCLHTFSTPHMHALHVPPVQKHV